MYFTSTFLDYIIISGKQTTSHRRRPHLSWNLSKFPVFASGILWYDK
ncbi:hypothetical protein CLOSTHATH_00772 [Hungatella hathewayi DSM 13479]|uniref:Uncharacterized protein n=1 Tax=Hungatella hathewayi DSM 13479 TaxID=566550 RepID=D3AB01_9FIRM|nr:hypothetical protein CLOSTHATH_00772 [Hungatella hathewayi DSM 13479]